MRRSHRVPCRLLLLLLAQMLGSASTAPSAREVTRSARSTGDMLRLVREQVASMQGAVQSASVSGATFGVGGGRREREAA